MKLNIIFEIQSIHKKDLFVQEIFKIQFKNCFAMYDENLNYVLLLIRQNEYRNREYQLSIFDNKFSLSR